VKAFKEFETAHPMVQAPPPPRALCMLRVSLSAGSLFFQAKALLVISWQHHWPAMMDSINQSGLVTGSPRYETAVDEVSSSE
jgi:hypothetical protein